VEDGDLEVWARPLKGGDKALILFNRGKTPKSITAGWDLLQWPEGLEADAYDLWSKARTKGVKGKFTATVASHGVVMVRLTPKV
jgi:alpha-galactosidase